MNTWYYTQPDKSAKKRIFKITPVVWSIYFTGTVLFKNICYFIQIFLIIPVTFCLDLVIIVIISVFKIFYFLFLEIKKLTFKLLYELLKALFKPFVILFSIALFGIVLFALFTENSVIEVIQLIIQSL